MPSSAPRRPPQQGVRRLHPPPVSTVAQRVRWQQSAHVEDGGRAIQDRAIHLRGVRTLEGSGPFSPTTALEPAPARSLLPECKIKDNSDDKPDAIRVNGTRFQTVLPSRRPRRAERRI